MPYGFFNDRVIRVTCSILLILNVFYANAQSDSLNRSNLDTLQLSEVVIKAGFSVNIRKDTITLSVDSFYKNQASSAQELFRKLPGFEIGPNGEYRIQGQSIAKTFIDGKEYDLNDLAVLFQQLPAELISKIQVSDWVDEGLQYAGLRSNSRKKSINVILNKDKVKNITVKPVLAYGTQHRQFESLFSHLQKGRLRGIANVRSTNTSIVDLSSKANALGSQSEPGIRIDRNITLNVSLDTIAKTIIKLSYEFANIDVSAEENLKRNTYLGADSTLILKQQKQSHDIRDKHTFKLHQKSYLSKYFRVMSDLNVSSTTEDLNSVSKEEYYSTYNKIPLAIRELRSNTTGSSASMIVANNIQWKFRNVNRLLYVTQEFRINESFRGYSIGQVGSLGISNRKDNANTNNISLGLQYIEPIYDNNHFLFKVSYASSNSQNNKDVSQGQQQAYDTFQSYRLKYRNTALVHGISHQYSNKKLSSNLTLDVQTYRQDVIENLSDNRRLSLVLTHILPSLSCKYAISRNSNLLLSSNTSVVFPDLNQLQPTPDFLDSFNVFIGNPALKPERKITTIATYNYAGAGLKKIAWCSLGLNISNDKIEHSVEMVQARRYMKPINIGKTYNAFFSANYSQSISKAVKLSIGLQADNFTGVSFIDGVEIHIRRSSLQPHARLELLQIDNNFEARLSYQSNLNDIQYNSSARIFSSIQNIATNGSYYLPLNFIVSYDLAYVVSSGIQLQSVAPFIIANFTVEKTFPKLRGFFIRAQLFDALKSTPNFIRKVGDNFYEDITFNRIGRFALLSASYTLGR